MSAIDAISPPLRKILMSIERPPTLSPKEMDQLLERLANSGAKLTMVDPRVSQTQTWIMATVGSVLVAIGGWGVVSINRLSESLAVVINQITYSERTDQAQDKRFDNNDRRLEILDERIRNLESFHHDKP